MPFYTDMEDKNIVFIGDCILDFINYVDRMPKMGETMCSNNFAWGPGGKAANACVTASRLTSKCSIICKLGDDIFGRYYAEDMRRNGIDTSNVYYTKDFISGCACVMVDKNGYNAIVVNNKANELLSKDDVKNSENLIKTASVVVSNTMIDVETANYALKLGKLHNAITVLNFASSSNILSDDAVKNIDILVANEVEAEALSGVPVNNVNDAYTAINKLLERDGFNLAIIVTLGENGVVWADKKSQQISYVPCRKVNVVDTTGAGDAFVGALTHYLLKLGANFVDKAIELATEYATLTVMSSGTQTSYPYLNDLEEKFKL